MSILRVLTVFAFTITVALGCAPLEDAEAKGAQVISLVPGATFNDVMRKIPPQLVLDPTEDMTVMREEIFGPVLPVKTYRDIEEVIDPRDTRPLLCEWVGDAYRRLAHDLGPKARGFRP